MNSPGYPEVALAADKVATSYSMGIREGSALLKEAGSKVPKEATTTCGESIFFARAAHLLNNNFSQTEFHPSMLGHGTIQERANAAMRWQPKSPSDLDKGASVLLKMFADKDGHPDHVPKSAELILTLENQHLALLALDKMVALGLVKNGSEIAGNSIDTLLRCKAAPDLWFDTQSGEALFISWLDRLYRGADDSAWFDPAHKKALANRPDISPKGTIETSLAKHLPAPNDAFWDQPPLPRIVFSRIGYWMSKDKKDYSAPGSGQRGARDLRPGDQARIMQFFLPWIERMDTQRTVDFLSTPYGSALFSMIEKGLPDAVAKVQATLIERRTVPSNALKTRRSL